MSADPVPRAVAIVGLIGVASIHFGQVVPTMKDTPIVGTGFVLLTIVCAAVALRLLGGASRGVWLQVAAINALAIGGYVFTRAFSSFIDRHDVGNWSEMLGLVALLVEGWLDLLSLWTSLVSERAR